MIPQSVSKVNRLRFICIVLCKCGAVWTHLEIFVSYVSNFQSPKALFPTAVKETFMINLKKGATEGSTQ